MQNEESPEGSIAKREEKLSDLMQTFQKVWRAYWNTETLEEERYQRVLEAIYPAPLQTGDESRFTGQFTLALSKPTPAISPEEFLLLPGLIEVLQSVFPVIKWFPCSVDGADIRYDASGKGSLQMQGFPLTLGKTILVRVMEKSRMRWIVALHRIIIFVKRYLVMDDRFSMDDLVHISNLEYQVEVDRLLIIFATMYLMCLERGEDGETIIEYIVNI